jgi:hypothetical protein
MRASSGAAPAMPRLPFSAFARHRISAVHQGPPRCPGRLHGRCPPGVRSIALPHGVNGVRRASARPARCPVPFVRIRTTRGLPMWGSRQSARAVQGRSLPRPFGACAAPRRFAVPSAAFDRPAYSLRRFRSHEAAQWCAASNTKGTNHEHKQTKPPRLHREKPRQGPEGDLDPDRGSPAAQQRSRLLDRTRGPSGRRPAGADAAEGRRARDRGRRRGRLGHRFRSPNHIRRPYRACMSRYEREDFY